MTGTGFPSCLTQIDDVAKMVDAYGLQLLFLDSGALFKQVLGQMVAAHSREAGDGDDVDDAAAASRQHAFPRLLTTDQPSHHQILQAAGELGCRQFQRRAQDTLTGDINPNVA